MLASVSPGQLTEVGSFFLSSRMFGRELCQVILCNEITTFAVYLCLRRVKRVKIYFLFQHTVVLQMNFPVSSFLQDIFFLNLN